MINISFVLSQICDQDFALNYGLVIHEIKIEVIRLGLHEVSMPLLYASMHLARVTVEKRVKFRSFVFCFVGVVVVLTPGCTSKISELPLAPWLEISLWFTYHINKTCACVWLTLKASTFFSNNIQKYWHMTLNVLTAVPSTVIFLKTKSLQTKLKWKLNFITGSSV